MMSTTRDYYEILGVSKSASMEDIKKSYRQLVMKYHPDRVPADQKKQAEEKFKEISEAYAVLSDPQKRQLYDQYGHAGIDSRYSTEDIFRSADFSSIFGSMGAGFSDIFEHIFSDFGVDIFGATTGSRKSRRQTGDDLQLKLSVSLEEANSGVEKEVNFTRYDSCPRCRGSGAEPGSSKATCPTCRGSGMVRSGVGFISFSQTCTDCGGEGKIIKNRCRECSGRGQVKSKKTILVKVPPGVSSGSLLRLRQEGNFAGQERGDLYIYIEVRPHPVFNREGDNIRCKVTIGIAQAILGTEIDVPTLDGKVKMTIPPGTQPHTVFRLKGKGIVNLHSKRPGDEFVVVDIEVPTRLSARERKLIEEWAKLRGENI